VPAADAPPSDDQPYRETTVVRSPVFPGLVGRFNVGAHYDMIGLVRSSDKGGLGSRLRFEASLSHLFTIGLDYYLPNNAVGPSFTLSLPRYHPLGGATSRFALLPQLTAFIYAPEEPGLFLGWEANLRLAVALLPHLLLSASGGLTLIYIPPFDRSPYVDGAYLGLSVGGGARWVF
jgi:hypothetical protein